MTDEGVIAVTEKEAPPFRNDGHKGELLLFLLLPLAGGSARVPCQINDLAGWEREGDF